MKKETTKYIEELRISHIVNEVIAKYIDNYKKRARTVIYIPKENIKIEKELDCNFYKGNSFYEEILTDEEKRCLYFNLPLYNIEYFNEKNDLITLIVSNILSKEQIGDIIAIMNNNGYVKIRKEYPTDKDIKFIALVFKQKKPKVYS